MDSDLIRQRLDCIPPSEIERLLRIMSEAQGFIRHDIVGEIAEVRAFFSILKRRLDREMTDDDKLRLKALLVNTESSMNTLFRVLNVHLVGEKIRWSLISDLSYIAKDVSSILEEQGVKVLPLQGPSAHVIFPENALYSVLLELARNAAVHANGSQVALEWSLQPDTIALSVHDSGKEISHLLTDRFVALELSSPELFKAKGGLSIIRRIVHCSEGLLLARRSAILGGAEFSVRLPIISYFEEDKK